MHFLSLLSHAHAVMNALIHFAVTVLAKWVAQAGVNVLSLCGYCVTF
jgi:hypothetical protein